MANEMKSRFFDSVGSHPLQEYPRPQLERDSYLNLNGIWDYAIYPTDRLFQGYQGTILVPFSPEALLSGVLKTVTPKDTLYYKRDFYVTSDFLKAITLLHFDAVDYRCIVTLNGKAVGEHKGGFTPFTFNVTDAVTEGENVLEIRVTDPTDTSFISHGKQSTNPGGIWYTPQSGIWQTVWMESVTSDYVKDLTVVPNIDENYVSVKVESSAKEVTVRVYDNSKQIAVGKGKGEIVIPLEAYECWCPENPKLYNLVIESGADVVHSYFGMRKFSVGKDDKGISRLFLNNKPYYHNGVLDQGYWSDGKLTPPSDDAMVYDIKMLKDMGFNMIRKHIKIEPLRWYYHCDRLGMLVWQDMVNGGSKYNFAVIGLIPFFNINLKDNNYRLFGRMSEQGRKDYVQEMKDTIQHLKNTPSLAMWVPFNEGWGQFDANKISEMIQEIDPTRTIDRTSGWHDQGKSDFVSKHIYFYPIYVPKDDRCYLLSEFGGFSKMTPGHMYNKLLFGYRMYFTKHHLERAYKKTFEKRIIANIPKGLSASVFTQVSDVEGEINGLITYDRKIEKVDRQKIFDVNKRVKI